MTRPMEEEVEQSNEETFPLGELLHSFTAKTRSMKVSKRAIEISGVGGLALVLVGLIGVGGIFGIILAILGGGVAVAAYRIHTRKDMHPAPIRIQVRELGLVCSQGDASREVYWNEVVDISCKKMDSPDGIPTIALVFETVATPPLIVMVGGTFSDASETAKLLNSLRSVWIPVWCRRARVLAEYEGVRIGSALLRCDCIMLGEEKLSWSSIKGFAEVDGVDCLETLEGNKGVEDKGMISPFPSTARRIAALAEAPPAPPMLPPPLSPPSPPSRK